MKKSSMFVVLLALIAGQHLGSASVAFAMQPNILFLLVDDLAWSDLACYGHPWHQTPNIDGLAQSGMRFTQGYAPAPICSASRASILCGKTTARLGFEFVTKYKPGQQQIDAPTLLTAPPFKLNLPLKQRTIAEYLGDAGYETAFFGKWHLNQHHGGYLGWSPTHGPSQQGFQIAREDFGAHPYSWKKSPQKTIHTVDEFAGDTMINGVCDYLSAEHSQPFFAMVSSFYVHTPVKTPCQWLLDRYENVIPLSAGNRQNRIQYAAFVTTLDHHVGRILDALDRSGQRDNTLIVFMSDNGGHPEFTGNGPLRGSKWNLYEGGVRVPLIASWANEIKPNSRCDVPVIGYDLLPTFVELAGGHAVGVDGVSIQRLLRGDSIEPDRDLIWHFPYYHPERGYGVAPDTIGIDDFVTSKTHPQSAIRRGRFKLIWFAEDEHVELYHLHDDPGEQNNLAASQAERAQQMQLALLDQLKQMKARMAQQNATSPTPK
ncbi:sulfatase [Stieleria varia]|uniref:Arylsulfatase n=1 Tax=Stieleria varia TaxID=2528005 RepID=A0A5C6B7C7_9BACT|nr:sulfatase [Stieleria varia]TWU07908.1 Arylsulfatase precursor [Stieleria varia]